MRGLTLISSAMNPRPHYHYAERPAPRPTEPSLSYVTAVRLLRAAGWLAVGAGCVACLYHAYDVAVRHA